MITAANNSQLKYLSGLLKKKKMRDTDRVFVCEGKKMFFEVLSQAPERIQKVYWSEQGYQGLSEEERALLSGISYELVADAAFDRVAETVTPQGVLAIVSQPSYTIEEICGGSSLRLLLLENLQDPGNLGTILRTAEAAGMNGILLTEDTVDLFNPKVVRSTMGAILRVPFAVVEDIPSVLDALKADGVTFYAADLQGSVPYTEPVYPNRFGIIIGNEGRGLRPETSLAADVRIRIPMEGKVESLNAAVAAAILMFYTKKY